MIPYGTPIEVMLAISQSGPCLNYKQVSLQISSVCETNDKYQYKAIRNQSTGTVQILYGQLEDPLNSVRAFDVSWSSSTSTTLSTAGSTSSDTQMSMNTSDSLLLFGFLLIIVFLVLIILWLFKLNTVVDEMQKTLKTLVPNPDVSRLDKVTSWQEESFVSVAPDYRPLPHVEEETVGANDVVKDSTDPISL